MRTLESDLYVSSVVPPPAAGFGEPDWMGDADYVGDLTEADIDRVLVALDMAIRAEAEPQAWRLRRAALDLQSIRGQIARHRRDGRIDAARLSPILSRLDRLRRCVAHSA